MQTILTIKYVQSDDATVNGTFECTPDHRFWSLNRHNFLLAKELKDGEEFYLRSKRVKSVMP